MTTGLSLDKSDFHACELKFPVDWHLKEHVHPDRHELIVPVSGGIRTEIRDTTLQGQTGNALFYPKNVPHEEWATGPGELRMLFFTWKGDPEEATQRYPLMVTDRNGRIGMLARWIIELSPTKDPQEQQLRESLFDAIMYLLRTSKSSPEDEMVFKVKQYIHAHLAEPIRLEDLAGVAGLTKFHFTRAFRKATGLTPMRFLRQTRVEAASALIRDSKTPMHRIATLVGINDEYQLSRIFRRITGAPPTAARKI